MTTTLTLDEALTVLYQHIDTIRDTVHQFNAPEGTAEHALLKQLAQLALDMQDAIDEYDELGAVDHE